MNAEPASGCVPSGVARLPLTPLRRWWMLPLAAAGFVSLSLWFRPEIPRAVAGVNDFMGIYAGARLVGSPAQFDADAYLREQLGATGWSAPSILYTRLPVFAFLFRPLGAMPYRRAYAVWQALSLASLAAFLILWPAPDRALLLCAACCSFPLFAAVAGGQDLTFLLLVLVLIWRLGESRPLLAGVLLAITTLKFHLFLAVPVFLLAQRRWRMLAAGSAGAAVLLAACFAVAGRGWPSAYARFVLHEQTNPTLRNMPNLHGLLAGLPHDLAWEVLLAVPVFAAVAWVARRTSYPVGLSAALIGGLLTSHHAYPADAVLLLPALLTLIRELHRLSVRVPSVVLLSPLPFIVVPAIPLVAPAPWLLLLLLASLAAVANRLPSTPDFPRHQDQ